MSYAAASVVSAWWRRTAKHILVESVARLQLDVLAETKAVHNCGTELTEATWQSLVASPLRESLRLLDLSECGNLTAECV